VRARLTSWASATLCLAAFAAWALSYRYEGNVTWFRPGSGVAAVLASRGELLCAWGPQGQTGVPAVCGKPGSSLYLDKARRYKRADLPNGWLPAILDYPVNGETVRISRTVWAVGGVVYQVGVERHGIESPLNGTETLYARRLLVPVWPIVLATAILPARRVARHARRVRRERAGRCVLCGYDLRASRGACPECGAPGGGEQDQGRTERGHH
jgi:hypothetical protein